MRALKLQGVDENQGIVYINPNTIIGALVDTPARTCKLLIANGTGIITIDYELYGESIEKILAIDIVRSSS